MGCFSIFPCFSNSKHQKLKKSVTPTTSFPSPVQGNDKDREYVLITIPTEESTNLDSVQNNVSESRETSEDQLINDSDEKTVSINLDVKTNTDVSIKEVEIHSPKNEKEREKEENRKLGPLVEIQIEKDLKKDEDEDLELHVEIDEVKKEDNKNDVQSQAFSDSSVSSYISYPPMHRYHNCSIHEEEEEEEEEDHVLIQEDSSESLFSLPINPRRQSKSNPVEFDNKEVNSPLKIVSSPELNTKPNGINHNQNTNSQLNPIENLTRWKTLKARTRPTLDSHQEKENIYLEEEEINIPLSKEPNSKALDQKVNLKNESVVTTSLSSWLIEPDSRCSNGNSYSYSDSANSWKSFEDRPILGALTMEELRQISARSSPRKSPCRNPDDMPIIGSVGSYWSHTGQATDSSNSCTSPLGMSTKSRRNREKKASSCTPVKRRLEKAMDKGAA